MRNGFIAILSIILITSLNFTPIIAANNQIKVIINGSQIQFDTHPVIENGRTLVPLRAIFEGLGAVVEWDGSTQTVKGLKDDKIVILKINSTEASVNGAAQKLDVPATIRNGRTLVPLRFISESLGTQVSWNDATRTIEINSILDVIQTPIPTVIPTLTQTIIPTPLATITTVTAMPTSNGYINNSGIVITEVDLGLEVATIANESNTDVDMTGWKLVSVEGNQIFDFPAGFILKSGRTVKITSGIKSYSDGVNVLKWSISNIWNNGGDMAKLYDPKGDLVSSKK